MKTSQSHDDPSTTTDEPPLVLVEHDDIAWQWAATCVLEQAGYRVLTCPGPRQLPGSFCPLVAGDGCPLAERADVVVNGLRLDDPASRSVLRAIHQLRPELPLLVEVTIRDREMGNVPEGCRMLTFPVRSAVLEAVVAAATVGPPS